MQESILVVMPPLIVIIGALITQRFLFSLFLGIISASIIACDFDLMAAAVFMSKKIYGVLELAHLGSWDAFWKSSNLFILFFLLVLGFLIAMMRRSGAALAYGSAVGKRVKTKGGIERASLGLSALFFIDDYFSCLTVGSVMQPLFDFFKISRVRLALFVNVVAAPFVVLVPLSSWVAYIIGQLRSAGVVVQAGPGQVVAADAMHMYMLTIPFLFYAMIVLLALVFLSYTRFSWGIIAAHEQRAALDGNLFGGKAPIFSAHINDPLLQKKNATLTDFLFPILTLFVSVIGAILYMGGFFSGNALMIVLQEANTNAALFIGACSASILSYVFLSMRKKLEGSSLRAMASEGFSLMIGSIGMLILIWTLSKMLTVDLATGHYLASYFAHFLAVQYLPVMFFLFAALISLLLGTAYGTMGMLVPLMLNLVVDVAGVGLHATLAGVPILIPTLAAVICGSIIGNHLSPIADVMVFTAASAGAYHLDVVKAHASFTPLTLISTAVAFLCAGFLIGQYGVFVTAFISLIVGTLCCLGLMTIATYMWRWMQRME